MDADDFNAMVARNKAGLAALEAIHARSPHLGLQPQIDVRRAIIADQEATERTFGGYYRFPGAATASPEKMAQVISEVVFRKTMRAIDLAYTRAV